MNWLWFGCFIASVIFVVLAIGGVVFTSGKTYFRIVEVVLYLAAATLLMYAPIFFLQQSPVTAAIADLVNVMRVISLDAGYLDNTEFIQKEIGSGLFYRLYMAVLGVLHFSMPLVSVLAMYRLLFRFYSNTLIGIVNRCGRQPIYVFSEINPGTARLSANIQKERKNGSYIFANVSEEEQKGSEHLGKVILHPDSIQNIRLQGKGKREIYYFFLSEDDNANITEALDMLSFLVKEPEPVQKKAHLFIETHSDEAANLLDCSEKQEVDVNLFRMEEAAVYSLLEKHPLYESAKDGVISVLVIGLDAMAEAVIRTAAWCGQLPGYRLKIHVAGIGIRQEIDTFRHRYPGLLEKDGPELQFYDCTGAGELFETVRKHCPDTTYAVVTGKTDTEAGDIAVHLRREFLKLDGTYTNTPEIHAYIRSEDQEHALERLNTVGGASKDGKFYGLDSFGSNEQTYTLENVLDSDYELLAGSVHMAYESWNCDGEPDVVKGYLRFNELDINKRASRANAMHIRYKLAMLGLDYTRDTEEKEEDFAAALTGERLEELARAEHDRWRMFLRSEGWTEADLTEASSYRKAGLEEEGCKCFIMKMHPFLCPYDEMEQRAEALGCERKASDAELVRRIPDILHDRWGITGKQYRIVRKK